MLLAPDMSNIGCYEWHFEIRNISELLSLTASCYTADVLVN
jgi:hypothetical protein